MQVAGAGAAAGVARPAAVRSLNDKHLGDGVFLLYLCHAAAPRTVDWSLVHAGGASASEADRKANAQYAIRCVRAGGRAGGRHAARSRRPGRGGD